VPDPSVSVIELIGRDDRDSTSTGARGQKLLRRDLKFSQTGLRRRLAKSIARRRPRSGPASRRHPGSTRRSARHSRPGSRRPCSATGTRSQSRAMPPPTAMPPATARPSARWSAADRRHPARRTPTRQGCPRRRGRPQGGRRGSRARSSSPREGTSTDGRGRVHRAAARLAVP